MSDKKHIQPAGLFDSSTFGYSQVVTSPPGTLVFLAGQVAFAEDGSIVGEGDLQAQAAQAFANLGKALAAAGASHADLMHLRIYMVDYSLDKAMALMPLLEEFLGGAAAPAQTMVPVPALGLPGLLVELEGVAVVS